MIRIEDTLKLLKEHQPDADEMLVRRAYIFSARVHQGQLRKSGEPYLIHPVEVSYIVASLGLDAPSVAAALLHDTVEDTVTTIEEIEETFGKDVAFMVSGLTKIAKINFKSAEEAQAENFRRLLLAMVQDLRVILVKLADRLHNMRTMQYMPPEKQQRISRETLDIYAPLANRLGIAWIKTELEDLCFKYLYPEEYHNLAAQIAKTRAERESFIARVVDQVKGALEKQGLTAEVTGRPKHLWSIYQKMRSHHSLNNLYDIHAFRIIVDSPEKCYAALGYVHSLWKPIPGRFKDYIATPKENGYQSLHTSVIGPEHERIELQIRTQQMHDVACYGVAAHWNYKEAQYGRNSSPIYQNLQNSIMEVVKGGITGKDVADDLFKNQVFVFTPQGDVMQGLPEGATVLDFAYTIHTDLGHECTGARIDGVQVPIRTKLETGQYVEILRTPGSKPKADWLKFVVTNRAKAKIRAYLRQEDNARSEQLGIEKLDRELKRYGLNLNKMRKTGQLDECAKKGKFKSPHELFLAIGYEKVRLETILDLFLPEEVKREQLEAAQQEKESELERLKKVDLAKPAASTGGRTGVIVDGLEGIACHFPRCCSPVHGDPIVGFVSAGQCVTIHRIDCPQVANYDNGRKVDVRWEEDGQVHQSQVRVRVLGKDAPGLLASMSQALYDAGVNISGVSCRTTPERDSINIFTLLITDIEQLTQAMKLLKRIDGISTVERLNN